MNSDLSGVPDEPGPADEPAAPADDDRPRRRRRRTIRPPRLRTGDASAERHASWLELFFDLVFVVAVAELGETLAAEPNATGFLHYGALFVPVWWAWVGYIFYADRFEIEDVPYRLALLGAMLAIAAVAVSIPRAFASTTGAQTFAVCYVAVRAVLIGLYLRAHRQVPEARPLTGRYATGFVVGAVLWAISIAVPAPGRWWLWLAGMLIELATPLLSSSAIRRVPYNLSHVPERFGLFTIIVLGQTVAVVTLGVAEHGTLRAGAAVVAVGAFALAAALWWLYFEFADDSPLRSWLVAGQTWMYGHLLVFAGITASGEGALLAIRATEDGTYAPGGRWALFGGTGVVLLALGLTRAANLRSFGDLGVLVRLAGVLVATALGLIGMLGNGLAPAASVFVALALLFAVIGVETARTRLA